MTSSSGFAQATGVSVVGSSRLPAVVGLGCAWLDTRIPSRMCGKDDLAKAFAGKGGSGAEVLSTGLVNPGDEVRLTTTMSKAAGA